MSRYRIVVPGIMFVALAVLAGCAFEPGDEDGVLAADDTSHISEIGDDDDDVARSWIRRPDEACRPRFEGEVLTEVYGSWSSLSAAQVQLWQDGKLVDFGDAFTWLDASSCPFDLVIAVDLADNPSHLLADLTLDFDGERRTEIVKLDTGLLRARAYFGTRRISGVAHLFRVDESGHVGDSPVGTIGLNYASREISAGTYEIRTTYRGHSLVTRITVGARQTRGVTLRG